jgi:rhodanese-related sulfurtransferase
MTGVPELSPEQAFARLPELQVVDVRAEHEFHGPLGRVRGSTLVPLHQLEGRAREIPRGRPLLLVCRSGARSARACEKLAALGIGPALNLAGGMIAWNRAGLPIEQTRPASLRELLDSLVAWLAQVSARDAAGVRGELREAVAPLSLDPPTSASVARALERAEASLQRSGAPPDLEPSLACFRRWLAAL